MSTLNGLMSCRQCGCTTLKDRGPAPKGRKFADRVLRPPLPGGRIYECVSCGLVFRFPTLTEAEYEALYESVSGSYWQTTKLRGDQRQVCEEIKQRFLKGKVLDVGCYDGLLPTALGDQFEKYGIEACAEAIAVAEQRGVKILARKIREISQLPDQEFDIITAVDVIEHVPDPKLFLQLLMQKLKPGGIIITSTGNSKASSWKIFGARYWYSSYPDHISFISPSWSENVAKDLGLVLLKTQEFRYNPSTGKRALYEWCELVAKFIISTVEVSLVRFFSSSAKRLGPRLSLGRHGMFKDHFLAIFVRPEKPG
ncbi:MAG TPA: methyltransferase domain-containing protein [Methylophilaceae bacterium]|nr:methyltransferase domain-containing protein [Methylophilaceae bacterium]